MSVEAIALIALGWAFSAGVTVGRAIKMKAPDPAMWGFVAVFTGPLALMFQTALYLTDGHTEESR